jgi:2,5-furandicarboxylate decarboxylase 1
LKDLREFLAKLKEVGELQSIHNEVSTLFEIPAILQKSDLDNGPAILFENIKGYSTPLLGNLCGTRKRIALALKCQQEKILFHYLDAMNDPTPCRIVNNGPVKEVIIEKSIDLGSTFPILTYHEKDSGPYITAGMVIYKDPVTGIRNASIHRLQLRDKDRLGILAASRPLLDYLLKAEKMEKPLEVAVSIGLEPSTLLASTGQVPVGHGKLDLVASLRGETLEMVRCETVDIEVPSHAEIVIEGEILPRSKEKDGPFGETSGYYVETKSPSLVVKAITHRKNPIFQAILPESTEALNLSGIPTEAAIYLNVKKHVPNVNNVHSSSFLHAVISITKTLEQDPRTAILATLVSQHAKHVVIVDDDVNVFNYKDVEWAIATRMQGDKDIIILPRMLGTIIDPSSDDGITTKVGIDATKPLISPHEKYERLKIPGGENIRLQDYK